MPVMDGPSSEHRESAIEPQRREAVPVRWFAVLASALTATVLLVYWLAPTTRRDLPHENGVVEWATALLFLAATVVGGRRLRGAGWRDPRWIIPVLSLLAVLDEVNWVIFPLGVTRPTVLGMRVDGLHDAPEFAMMLIRDHAPWWCILVLGVAMASSLWWAVLRAPRWWRFVNHWAPWRFFALAAGLGAIAQILDLVTHRSPLAQLFEEILEMDGALAMLFSACLLGPRPPARR